MKVYFTNPASNSFQKFEVQYGIS